MDNANKYHFVDINMYINMNINISMKICFFSASYFYGIRALPRRIQQI